MAVMGKEEVEKDGSAEHAVILNIMPWVRDSPTAATLLGAKGMPCCIGTNQSNRQSGRF
jgi:hypothetical protein